MSTESFQQAIYNPDVNVVVASEPNREAGIAIQRLNLRQDLATEFRTTAHGAMPTVNEDLALREYEPGYNPDSHELSYLELAGYEQIAEQVRQVSQIQQAELFREDDAFVDHLRFYAIVASLTARNRAVFFRTYNPTRELSRHRGFAALMDRYAYGLSEYPKCWQSVRSLADRICHDVAQCESFSVIFSFFISDKRHPIRFRGQKRVVVA